MGIEKRKIATMEELSSAAGVSRPTLSKYFHDSQSVLERTRLRIERALEVYDYRPNIFAINQNRASTKTIGIVVPYLSDPFFAEIVRNIERSCIARGFLPILFSAHGERQLENDALSTLESLKPAGALIAPLGRISDLENLRRFAERVPTVIFDSSVGIGETFVGSDNDHSIGLLVDHLCETGDAPCFLEMQPVNPNAEKRRSAFIAAMERRGLTPEIVRLDEDDWEFERIGRDGAKRLIADRRLPSQTVLCSNDRLAIGFLAGAHEMGLRVGRGDGCALRVAGHDDHPSSRFTCPALTTATQNYESVAQRSVESLFGIMEVGTAVRGGSQVLFKGELKPRASA